MTFIIRDVKFEIVETTEDRESRFLPPEYQAPATFNDGAVRNITDDLGVGPSDSESGCCLQILLWIENNGI